MKTKLFFWFALFVCFSFSALGQEKIEFQDSKILWYKENYGGLLLHTAGWGLAYRNGSHVTGSRKRVLEFDLVHIKHPKEIKFRNVFDGYKSYVLGKKNSFYTIRMGLGMQKILNYKPFWGGVELRMVYSGGLALGLAKPVYLLILNDTIVGNDISSTERYDPYKHNNHNIIGRASFYQGLNQLSFHPGGYVKLGFSFEFGSMDEQVKVVEIGVLLDGYAREVEIMAFNDPQRFFLTYYLSFYFGKRFNK